MPSRIEDYALIGDCQTAALVSPEVRSTGSACRGSTREHLFAALLDGPEYGRWQIAARRGRAQSPLALLAGNPRAGDCFRN